MSDDNGDDDTVVPFPGTQDSTMPGDRGPKRGVEGRKKTDIARRERDAVQLYLAKVSLDEIAQRLGYANRGGAHKAIMRKLERDTSVAAQDVLLALTSELDVMQRAIWSRVLQGDDDAIDRALKIGERRAKLLGLERMQLAVTGPDGGPAQVQVVADVRQFISLLAAVGPIVADGATPNGNGKVVDPALLPGEAVAEAGDVPPDVQP